MTWTDETTQRLAELWDQDRTGSEIAGVIGKSRGAVLAKAHRMDLPGRKTDERKPVSKAAIASQRAWRESVNPKKGRPPKASGPTPLPAERAHPGRIRVPCELVTLDPVRDCKWPINRGGPYLFCAEPRAHPGDDSRPPYCAFHADRATEKRR